MHKLLPFRQYDENDVINLFNLDVSSGAGTNYSALAPKGTTFSKGGNYTGTLVVSDSGNTNLGADKPTRTYDSYLGAIGSGDQGPYALKQGSFYPTSTHQVGVADDADAALGITLRCTMAWDENGEKLLYYPVKKDEFQAVLPGEAVPIATRGFFTLTVGAADSDAGIVSTSLAPGSKLAAAANGKFEVAGGTDPVLATVLATGTAAGKSVAFIKLG